MISETKNDFDKIKLKLYFSINKIIKKIYKKNLNYDKNFQQIRLLKNEYEKKTDSCFFKNLNDQLISIDQLGLKNQISKKKLKKKKVLCNKNNFNFKKFQITKKLRIKSFLLNTKIRKKLINLKKNTIIKTYRKILYETNDILSSERDCIKFCKFSFLNELNGKHYNDNKSHTSFLNTEKLEIGNNFISKIESSDISLSDTLDSNKKNISFDSIFVSPKKLEIHPSIIFLKKNYKKKNKLSKQSFYEIETKKPNKNTCQLKKINTKKSLASFSDDHEKKTTLKFNTRSKSFSNIELIKKKNELNFYDNIELTKYNENIDFEPKLNNFSNNYDFNNSTVEGISTKSFYSLNNQRCNIFKKQTDHKSNLYNKNYQFLSQNKIKKKNLNLDENNNNQNVLIEDKLKNYNSKDKVIIFNSKLINDSKFYDEKKVNEQYCELYTKHSNDEKKKNNHIHNSNFKHSNNKKKIKKYINLNNNKFEKIIYKSLIKRLKKNNFFSLSNNFSIIEIAQHDNNFKDFMLKEETKNNTVKIDYTNLSQNESENHNYIVSPKNGEKFNKHLVIKIENENYNFNKFRSLESNNQVKNNNVTIQSVLKQLSLNKDFNKDRNSNNNQISNSNYNFKADKKLEDSNKLNILKLSNYDYEINNILDHQKEFKNPIKFFEKNCLISDHNKKNKRSNAGHNKNYQITLDGKNYYNRYNNDKDLILYHVDCVENFVINEEYDQRIVKSLPHRILKSFKIKLLCIIDEIEKKGFTNRFFK